FAEGSIEETVRKQAQMAGDEADVLILLVDSQTGLMPDDYALSQWVRATGKPALLVANKIDDGAHEDRAAEFYELGLGPPHPISAISGRGVGDLLDEVLGNFAARPERESDESGSMGLAIIGVPNSGKSSFLNAILKEEKSIVTDIPGTTRDSVDSYLKYMGQRIRLIDTAGLRRKARISDDIEYYSTVRTLRAIDECDVAIVMIDAVRGFHMQDVQIMSLLEDRGKGLVVAVNKWDAIDKDGDSSGRWVKQMQDDYKALLHTPILFISVHHNQRLWKTIGTALEVYAESQRQISTAQLNKFLQDATGYLPPPAVKGKRIQIKYATQVHRNPQLFAFFCNHPKLVPVTYKRYLQNRLRERFGFNGVPIKVSFRKK
ncbi:MAG: ribosome biogenesis GTPase Der, partial [Candidatus Marinimicrobia bacterium]|nr:ribosome biogenesis GTPase Der [Candidatus Neomarinimicrobiota bacterium]